MVTGVLPESLASPRHAVAGAAAVAIALAVAAMLLLPGLGAAPFDDPGEGMHAEIARELLGSGRPFALTLNGVPYVDKPPLLYALIASALALAGPSEGAARLVPALAAMAAVGATAWMGSRLLGPLPGLLAGLALLTSTGFFVFGRYVRPETLFVAALALGFALTLTGIADGRPRRTAAGLAAFGAAALAKDPLGALGPPLAIAAAVLLAGRGRPVRAWLPWPGVIVGASLAFGWWALAEAATPGFVWYTVVDNHVMNVAGVRAFPDEDVPLSAVQFLAVALLGAAPWFLPAGAVAWRLARRRAWRDPAETPWVALAIWAVAVLALTSLSAQRLPHYGLPAYPALALLAARGWRDLDVRRLASVHAAFLALLAGGCALAWSADGGWLVAHVLDATDVATRKSAVAGVAAPVPPWATLQPLLGIAAIALGAGALALAVAARARARAVAAAATVGALMLLQPAAAVALQLVSAHRAVEPLATALAREARPDDLVVHEGPIESSGALEWYGSPRPVIVDGRTSVLGFGAGRAGARERFWEADRLRVAWGGGRRVWLVSVRPPERSLAASLPGARLVLAAGGRWLYVNRGVTGGRSRKRAKGQPKPER